MQGSCKDGKQTSNPMTCAPCTISALLSTGQRQCPAAGKLPVRRGTQTVLYLASEFRSNCTEAKGLDCIRRQGLMYPFDGNDLLEDLAPRNARLEPVSASKRSDGPSMELLRGTVSSKTTAARFNASNHEYYRIPPLYNMFDPSLAVRVIPGSRYLYQGEARKIQSTIVWEQVRLVYGCND